MTVLPAVARLGLELEDDDFAAFALFLDRCQYPGALDDGLARRDIIAVGDEQHPVQFDSAADTRVELFNVDDLAFDYLVLLAACFN